ncbi:MAG: hypothetical protein KDD50_06125, partial [Bdellovibrionales bacterium]|nr:hypothetical protein [Bdellovibrionales bacterium]
AKVNGKKSLKGLRLNDGQIINSDIRIIQVRHPGSLSPSLSNNFKENLAKLLDFEEDGWEFYSTDDGEVNQLKKYHSASSFNFNAKPPIPVKDFPLGKSKAVIVNSSLASRNGQQIIVFGGREKPYFNRTQVNNAKNGTPAEGREFFFNSQPWNPPKTINQFDRGPGKEWAALFNSVPEDKVFQTKPGMKFESDGIDAYVVKNTPKHGSFAYHRGTTENPEVLIFADPSDKDYDDLYTARALTGENGQYLQGLMSQLGVKENYLIIKTVPFDMTDATEAEWDKVRELLRPWRNKVFAKAIKLYPKLIVTLGKHSSSDLYSYLNDNHLENINFISLEYDRHSFESHFSEMAHQLGQSPSDYKWEMNSIPRSHLPYPMQTWIGTSGARGIRASGKYAGDYYGIVTPYWVIEEANRVYRNPREGLLNPELDFVQFAKNLVREFGFSSLGKTMSSPPLR